MFDKFAAALTWSAAVNQNITVYWKDRQSATYNAGTLEDIITDETAKFFYITLADTGEVILDPDNAYIEQLTNIYDEHALIITHDGLNTTYSWTPYSGIKCHYDFHAAYRYLYKNGFID